jgi:hypothetical protein
MLIKVLDLEGSEITRKNGVIHISKSQQMEFFHPNLYHHIGS